MINKIIHLLLPLMHDSLQVLAVRIVLSLFSSRLWALYRLVLHFEYMHSLVGNTHTFKLKNTLQWWGVKSIAPVRGHCLNVHHTRLSRIYCWNIQIQIMWSLILYIMLLINVCKYIQLFDILRSNFISIQYFTRMKGETLTFIWNIVLYYALMNTFVWVKKRRTQTYRGH